MSSLQNWRDHTHQTLYTLNVNLYLHEFLSWFYFLIPMFMVQNGNFGQILKSSQIFEARKAMPTKIDLHAFHINLYLFEFFEPILFFDPHVSQFYFLTPMDYRENLAVLEANEKEAKSLKLEGPRPSKLVCMHFMSTSTCVNFLSQFYFLTPMDYSSWS